MKKIYPRKCVNCKERFKPQQNTQICCSPWCAVEYVRNKNTKTDLKKWNKEKKEIKEKLMTKSDYEKQLQTLINRIVRNIDKGTFCHSTNKPLNDKYDAGHVFSCGSNPSIRFNLFNIYAQSVYANQYLSGDQINFIETLEKVFGSEHKEYVLSLRKLYPVIKLTNMELKEKISICKSIVCELEKSGLIYPDKVRLELRKKYNERIGIYK